MAKTLITLLAILAVAAALLFTGAQAGDTPAVGEAAPEFRLQDQDGDWHALEDYRGNWLAVYFYPTADTPGCTTEACNFRDNFYAFRAIGADVVGISVDNVDDQKSFSDQYELPFTILSDGEGATADAYGVLRDFKLMKVASRQSFIVDPEGRIAKHYEDVDPDTHPDEVLEYLKRFMANT